MRVRIKVPAYAVEALLDLEPGSFLEKITVDEHQRATIVLDDYTDGNAADELKERLQEVAQEKRIRKLLEDEARRDRILRRKYQSEHRCN